MSSAVGLGHFVSWEGGCLFIGRAVDVTPMHAHYALQVAFGSERGIRFRSSEREPWTEYGGVVIPSRQPHAMDATWVPRHAVLFVEPETREGRAIAERCFGGDGSGITALPDDAAISDAAAALLESWWAERGADVVAGAARRVLDALTGGVEPAVVADERILRAVRYVGNHLDAPLTLDEVAAEACLSPSRFRHLFVEQTGMALRPYILWRRFLRVWELMMRGASLSSAAHAAGFADAAHLSRTSRRTFGFPPSALQLLGPLATEHARAVAPPADAGLPPLRARIARVT